VSLLFLPTSPIVLALFVVLYGYAMGGNATLQATVVGEVFGRGYCGAIAGRMSPVIVTLQALGVPFVGWIHDHTGRLPDGILAHTAEHAPRRRLRAWFPRAA
jgi:MFS family permease